MGNGITNFIEGIGAASKWFSYNTGQGVTFTDGGTIYDYYFGGESSTLELVQFSATSTVVPVPAAIWLFGSGLIGLISVARRNKT